ncbi:hypothetical protein VK792_02165 [Mesobacterium sp. TK19101]|uniref:Uncharacterized protein n=1 Tax=Mesobacterium hydrothermale TaxID=3111907 RepID=A0ABU6HF40_9RHOB|nr:hypothetical protein [Mesobacterium sp. TK19101]MEC3860078.1 hypothetical protein [Mesobacterium sp. TK19101]
MRGHAGNGHGPLGDLVFRSYSLVMGAPIAQTANPKDKQKAPNKPSHIPPKIYSTRRAEARVDKTAKSAAKGQRKGKNALKTTQRARPERVLQQSGKTDRAKKAARTNRAVKVRLGIAKWGCLGPAG